MIPNGTINGRHYSGPRVALSPIHHLEAPTDEPVIFSQSNQDQSTEETSEEEASEAIPENTGSPCKKWFYRLLTFGSIVVDTPFVFFLVVATIAAFHFILKQFDLDDPRANFLWIILSGVLSALGTLCDVTIVNPAESAKELTEANTEDDLAKEIKQLQSCCQKNSTKTLTTVNQVGSNVTYLIGAAANALPVAYLSSEPIVQSIVGLPIVAFGVAYLNLVSWNPVRKHAYEWCRRLLNCQESMLVNILRTPARSLEVFIQSLSNALYRGVFFGYTMNQLLTLVFKQAEDEPNNLYYLYTISILALYITLFSRTLNVHEQYFDKKWEQLPLAVLQNSRVARKALVIDLLMALLRGIPTATLLYRHTSKNPAIKWSLAISIGSTILCHAMYVRYIRRLHETALKQQSLTAGLLTNYSAQDITSELLFDRLTECFKTERLTTTVTTINVGARIGRSLAFLGFLAHLNEILATHDVINLDFYDLLCLHQLWGNTSLENEASFFQKSVIDNLAYYRTKIHIEKTSPLFGWGSFWKSKSEYPREHLLRLVKMNTDINGDQDEHPEANPEPPATIKH